MQLAEKRQLENINTLYTTVYKLKQKVQDLLIKLETQLSEVRKVLESNRFTNEHLLVLTPMMLNPDPDPVLAKATEDRLFLFNHDTVPQYLRTKLDPKIESDCTAQNNRAANMPSEQVNKLANLANRIIDTSLKELSSLKQELEADFSDRQTKSNSSTEDFATLLGIINSRRNMHSSFP